MGEGGVQSEDVFRRGGPRPWWARLRCSILICSPRSSPSIWSIIRRMRTTRVEFILDTRHLTEIFSSHCRGQSLIRLERTHPRHLRLIWHLLLAWPSCLARTFRCILFLPRNFAYP